MWSYIYCDNSCLNALITVIKIKGLCFQVSHSSTTVFLFVNERKNIITKIKCLGYIRDTFKILDSDVVNVWPYTY